MRPAFPPIVAYFWSSALPVGPKERAILLSILLAWLPAAAGCRPALEQRSVAIPRFSAKPTVMAAPQPHPAAASTPAPTMILLKEKSVPLPAYSRLVGSRAADVAIEHWITPNLGANRPFTSFEPGRITVLEFWATWCPHCRAAFPLLASLQRTYADDGLTVIAVGREPPEALQAFLNDETEAARTATEAARTCVLATDPDGSVFHDYMECVAEIGLPTAFIIGRTGIVEWIGHPQDLDEPLRLVVADRWDRSAFLEKTRRIEAVRLGVTSVEEPLRQGRDSEAVAAYENLLAAHAGDAEALNEVAWLAWEMADLHRLPGSLLEAAVTAAGRSVDREPDNGNFLDTLAHLQALRGDLDEAIVTQRRAADHPGPFARRIQGYLRELEARRAAP